MTILELVAHRPWPMPDRPWIMTQSWHDLLFAHWPVHRDVIASLVPRELEVDTFDGEAWIGVVPFSMTNVAPRGIPAVPGISSFLELNVRTYVRRDGKPGVYFFSLDAGSSLAVFAARTLLNLPYYRATMRVEGTDGTIRYSSRRKRVPRAELVATYRPAGPVFNPTVGSLEYFLTERYCLYANDRSGRPYRLDIHHPAWALQEASAEMESNSMTEPAGINLPLTSPLLHFSQRQDMVAWPPTRLG